jgi:hypothetical protein
MHGLAPAQVHANGQGCAWGAATKFERPVLVATTLTKPDPFGELAVDVLRGPIIAHISRARLGQHLLNAAREIRLAGLLHHLMPGQLHDQITRKPTGVFYQHHLGAAVRPEAANQALGKEPLSAASLISNRPALMLAR